jgi:hypothetical protein
MTHKRVRTPEGSGPDAAPRVGRFTHHPRSGTWTWDDEVFRIHGLAPGAISPTTDYVLQCKHPEDRDRVAGVLVQAAATGEPFSVAYRLRGADGVERKVVLVCEGGMCEDDTVTTIDGYYIDLTDDFRQESAALTREAVAASAESRATIEQAKGSLMLAYGLDADQAFAMLSWWSRNRNVKVRDLAQRLVEIAREGGSTHGDLRTSFDVLLHDITAPAGSNGLTALAITAS